MFADAVEVLAAVLAAGWLGLLAVTASNRSRARRVAALAASGAAVGLFGANAVLADGIDDAGGGATRLDGAVIPLVVEHRTPALTAVAETLDVAAGLVGMTLLAVVAAAVLLRHRLRVEAGIVLAAPLAAGLLGRAKLGYDRARPPESWHLVAVGDSSLPSGHTLDATIVLGVLAVVAVSLLRARLARVAVVAAAGVGIAVAGASRVYLGVHWTSDVLAGWLLGGAWVAVTVAVLLVRAGPPTPRPRPVRQDLSTWTAASTGSGRWSSPDRGSWRASPGSSA